MSVNEILGILFLIAMIFAALIATGARSDDRFQSFANVAQGMFNSFAALGLIAAGLWVFLSEDWAPRTSLSVAADSKLIEGSNPRSAIVQISASLKNEGKLKQTFNYRAFVVRGYDPAVSQPNEHGDLATRNLGQRVDTDEFRLMPGETDMTYSEFRVACSNKVVQVFVDIEEPEHLIKNDKKPLSYERKLIVSLAEVCDPKTAARDLTD